MESKITQVPPRASIYYGRAGASDDVTEPIMHNPKRFIPRPTHHVVPFIAGALLILSSVLVWILLVIPWWIDIQTQWHYGDAKVSMLVADVGHGGQSQLLAFDYHGQETIIEIVGQKATFYRGGTFIGADRLRRVITLSLQDVNGDGKPDLVIQVVGMEGATVLFNTGTGFAWTST